MNPIASHSVWAVWLLIQRTHKASNWYLFLPSSFHLSPNIKNYSSSISMMNRSIWPQVIRISKIGSDLSLANYLWLRRMTHREIGQVWRTVKEPVRAELQSEVMDGPLEVRDPIKHMHNFMLGWVHYFSEVGTITGFLQSLEEIGDFPKRQRT